MFSHNRLVENAPRLAPPGAGLPGIELWIARLLFKIRAAGDSPKKAVIRLLNEMARIEVLLEDAKPETLNQPRLIPRLRGLEDSSRNWSVYMTLEHLQIVNTVISETVESLTVGRVPVEKASTAAVKPHVGISEEILTPYRESCMRLVEWLGAAETDLKTNATYSHPWFGPLSAAGWMTLSWVHMGIHRRQIEAITAP